MAESKIRPEIDPMRLHAKWGIVLDRLLGDEELAEAVRDILGYEQDVLVGERRSPLGVPADVANGYACYEAGREEGLGIAHSALLDRKRIAERRAYIESKDRKET